MVYVCRANIFHPFVRLKWNMSCVIFINNLPRGQGITELGARELCVDAAGVNSPIMWKPLVLQKLINYLVTK